MPNWCQNTAEFSHSDKSKLDELEKELQKQDGVELFMHLRPYEGEWEYMWCAENWGTKWECNVYDWSREDDNTIKVYFDTAWGPPLALFEFLSENEWQINAMYNEEGMCFTGYWNNDDACEYEYSGMTADEIEHSIPSDINEYFCISENRREWESDNIDDDEVWEKAEITDELQNVFQEGLGNNEPAEEKLRQALQELKDDFEKLTKDK